MRTFILLTAASTAVAFAPPQRMPAMTQMTVPAAAAPVAASRAVHKSNCRGATALAAARKKTEDMTPEEKAAETALNQQLLVAKGVLFLGVIGYFAFTSL